MVAAACREVHSDLELVALRLQEWEEVGQEALHGKGFNGGNLKAQQHSSFREQWWVRGEKGDGEVQPHVSPLALWVSLGG